jgi:hypothetical protein
MALPSLIVLGLLTLICLVLGWAFSRENTRVPNDSWTRTPKTRQTSGRLWGGSAVTGIDPDFITRQTMTVPLDISVPLSDRTACSLPVGDVSPSVPGNPGGPDTGTA